MARDTRRAGAALRCLALVAAAAVAGTAHQHMDTGSKTERGESFVPRPEQARIFSLGFDALVVPSWRQVVDLSNVDATLAVLCTGQSGNPASPQWNDQTPLWAAGELRPCPFTRAAVEAAATHRLVLEPG